MTQKIAVLCGTYYDWDAFIAGMPGVPMVEHGKLTSMVDSLRHKEYYRVTEREHLQGREFDRMIIRGKVPEALIEYAQPLIQPSQQRPADLLYEVCEEVQCVRRMMTSINQMLTVLEVSMTKIADYLSSQVDKTTEKESA